MITSIPDKIYKFAILIGVFLIGYSYIKSRESYDNYNNQYSYYESIDDSLKIINEYLLFEESEFKKMSDQIELKYNLDKLYTKTDDYIVFSKILTDEKNLSNEMNILESQWKKIQHLQLKQKILSVKKESFGDKHPEYVDEFKYWMNEYLSIEMIGGILLAIGMFLWLLDSIERKPPIKQYEKVYRYCQSCGNNFNSVRTYGKNSDGEFNLAFCKECYKNGKFIEPDLTKDILIDRLIEKKKINNRLSKFLFKIRIKSLDRWSD